VLEKLSQRERQVIALSEENGQLGEKLRAQQTQIQQLEEAGAAAAHLDGDQKTQELLKEKEQLSQRLRTTKAEFER